MTKKILAVLLAICMITGTCVLFASAKDKTTVSQNDYLDKSSYETATKVLEKGSDYEQVITVGKKTNPTMPKNQTEVKADNVDGLVTFTINNKTKEFSKDGLSKYFKVSGTLVGGNVSDLKFTRIADSGDVEAYQVDTVTKDTDGKITAVTFKDNPAVNAKLDPYAEIVLGSGFTISGVKTTDKFSNVTMGVRILGAGYKNLVNNEIAVVNANITRYVNGAEIKDIKSTTNVIEDLLVGDKVVLSTYLKDTKKHENDFYKFNCWVDEGGTVLSYDKEYVITVDGSNKKVYAAYSEIVGRNVITYTCSTNSRPAGATSATPGGKLTFVAAKPGVVTGRDVFEGDEQVSVLKGVDFEFTIEPEDGYEIAHVYVYRGDSAPQTLADYDYDIASFSYLVMPGASPKNLAELIKATGATRSVNRETAGNPVNGTYTFEDVQKDCWIHVVFQGIKLIEEPSGLAELPPAELGMELEGGPEGPEGAEPGAPGAPAATTVPAENGVAGAGAAVGGVVNPATGSESAIAVFAVMTAAACAAFVTMKKKKD